MDGLELDSVENIKSVLLISCGGILGSNIRFFLFERLGRIINNGFKIFFINNLASFLLGFFTSMLASKNELAYSDELELLIFIGFLGGLSSFSTFMYDLFQLYLNFEFTKLTKLFLSSIFFGLIFLSMGFLLGNK